jgi:hypothetical protein
MIPEAFDLAKLLGSIEREVFPSNPRRVELAARCPTEVPESRARRAGPRAIP